jgi:hypothetical protein
VGRKVVVGRKTLIPLRIQIGFVLVLGALLSGCGGSEKGEANENVPPTPGEAGSVVIRVSGAEGTAYAGNYETIEGELEIVEETTLGSEPVDYEVEIQEGASDGVTALFEKTQPGREELRVGILADEELVAESRTFAEFGDVIVDWFPQMGPPGTLQEDLLVEELPEDEQS